MSANDATRQVLLDIHKERTTQNCKWGEQNHPDGTGPDVRLFDLEVLPTYGTCARIGRNHADELAADGRSLWAPILLEEVFEALAEHDPARLRAELVQVAAVATAWVEALDRGGVRP